MSVIICNPKMTMEHYDDAVLLFNKCIDQLGDYLIDIISVKTDTALNQVIDREVSSDDILIFFNSDVNDYSAKMLKLIQKCDACKCRIWPIAMEKTCRKPPEPVSDRQSFDVSSRNENRYPLKNNITAIAQVLTRKIVAQTLSPYYRDEVMYFISHRRIDGEHITAKLADKLRELNRERNIYRDVVNVAVGDDAQKDINENLALSDVLIFIQTKGASESNWITKELIYAITHDIPILWIQIDNAPYDKLSIVPGNTPMLSYNSVDFDDDEKLQDIADVIEDNCFKLMMFSSDQVSSYIDCMRDLKANNKIEMEPVQHSVLSYAIQYDTYSSDKYANTRQSHFIQCFGRNPREADIKQLADRARKHDIFHKCNRVFLLSNHGKMEDPRAKNTDISCENYENYIYNLERNCGIVYKKQNRRIIISGAFPDNDEIYSASLMEALLVYCREIIRRGYILVFGAHPTFQQIIFDTAVNYSNDVRYSVEMHMDRAFINRYNVTELESKCTLILSDGLENMRERMISEKGVELLICMGGKIKADKSAQGVDIEVELAKKTGISVALVGTVGGRSSEYAREVKESGNWSELNNFTDQLNLDLLHNINHRLMVKRLLDAVD